MTFDKNIIGHDVPQKILHQAMLAQKFGHAYLFTGEEKIGKKLVALAVAKTLLCSNGVPFCGTCSSCHQANLRIHPDLFEISPEGQFIKLSQIKLIQEQMALHPSLSARKVFILDEADRLNPEASNAFLKSLEEPPPNTHFILITSRPQAILTTLFSRCQQVRFSIPPSDQLFDLLMRTRTLAPQDARYLIKRSDGRVGLACSIDLEALNMEDQRYFSLIHPETLRSPSKLFQLSEEMSRDSEHFRKSVEWILSCLRDTILWKASLKPDHLILDRHYEKLDYLSKQFSFDELNHTFHSLIKIEKLIQRNINRPLALDTILLQLRPLNETTPA
jgi:DNA polymerase-3 subunit delta'